MRLVRVGAAGACLVAGVALAPAGAAPADDFFAGCEPVAASPQLAVGSVTCQQLPSPAIGGTTAFSYFVPPACAPSTGARCPVIYLLHGFGGDYRSMLGTASEPSAYVSALTSGPARNPYDVRDPWKDADPAAWVTKPSINAVLIAPDGRTVPAGYGPQADLDGFWTDWNPRYAADGDTPRYDTPAPRFERHVLSELIPYVEQNFGVARGRSHRVLTGVSLGGYGTYAIGLRHPDLFVSLGSVSGAMNFLFAPGIDPTGRTSRVGVAPPVKTPTRRLPAVQAAAPFAAIPDAAKDFGVALLALGDPVADQAYFRGRMPRDLALNGHARSSKGQSVDLRGFWNDAVPHNPRDLSDLASYPVAQAFEAIVTPMNRDQALAFRDTHVLWQHEIHPGTHSGEYWNAWLRGLLEQQYAVLRAPAPGPGVFDFRSTDRRFAVWGWQFAVKRPTSEFLDLTDVSCRAISLKGSGRVTVTVPAWCDTGAQGDRTFTVDLGPSYPTDETAGLGASGAYGATRTVHLTSL